MDMFTWFIELLIKLVTFPVTLFWEQYEKYKEAKNTVKIILLFVGSLSGVLLIIGMIAWLVWYLINYQLLLLIIVVGIGWLYLYVKYKMDRKVVEPIMAPQTTIPNMDLLHKKAWARLDTMTNIVYLGYGAVASKIQCVVASDVSEIIDLNLRYDIIDGAIFYVYRFEKEDMGIHYDDNTIKEFTHRFQAKLNHMITSGKFRLRGYPIDVDIFGERLSEVCVEPFIDYGQYLYAWVAFDTAEYRDSQYRQNMQQTNNYVDPSLPAETWDDYRGL